MKNERHKTILDTLVVTALATLPIGCAMEASDGNAPQETQEDVHLTAAQQEALQAEVIAHLNDYGDGTQIGINQISFDDGNTILTLPLPGETRARAVGEPITLGKASDCHNNDIGWACLWSDTNFNGMRLEGFKCETRVLAAPFNSSTASVYNNQTTGTQTLILNGSGQVLNANLAPSRINDMGVLNRSQARRWRVCG